MKTNLQHTKIESGFKTPENYFENFSSKFFDDAETKLNIEGISNVTGFKVPNKYFENLESKLFEKIPLQPKVISIQNVFYKVASIAAILLITIIFSISYNNKQNNEIEMAEIAYLELNSEQISDVEIGMLLNDKEIELLEDELIYNDLIDNTLN